jgi:LPXTG-motif cell wall-anchored protein
VSPKVEKRGVKGEVKTREELPTTKPVAVFTADTSQSSGQLPLTGFNTLFQVILGGLSLMGGGFLFRRTREV